MYEIMTTEENGFTNITVNETSLRKYQFFQRDLLTHNYLKTNWTYFKMHGGMAYETTGNDVQGYPSVNRVVS